MEIGVLGPVALTGAAPVRFGGGRTSALLALLALEANRVVSVDRLMSELWPEDAGPSAGNLHVRIAHIRKALKEAGRQGCLRTLAPGYVLELGDDELDVSRYERLVRDGRGLTSGPERAAELFRSALAVWRGPALADVADFPFARAEARRLEEDRVTVLESRIEADLACGRQAALVAELETLVDQHPFRERLWAARMLALYRCGRQADALRCYRDLRTRLVDEMGIEPSPELSRLEAAVLLQSASLDLAAPATGAGAPTVRPAGRMMLVTLLLTDIEESTSAWAADPDRMAERLRCHDALVAKVVEARGGAVTKAKGEGDSTFSVLPTPSAALAASVDIQREMKETGLKVRMAVHSGEVEHRDGDYFGNHVNRAARARAAAHGGQILVTRAVAELVGDDLPAGAVLVDLGAHRLAGLPGAERLFQLSHPDLQATFPALRTLDARLANLPSETSSFVGRHAELAAVHAALVVARCVTLTGPGGTGKTRLAMRAAASTADKHPDGLWWVDLTAVADTDAAATDKVAEAVARAVGMQRLAGSDLTADVVERLRHKRALLVLDNCEQVTAAAAALVRGLLASPSVHVLATSRRPLGVSGERSFAVPPLSTQADDAGVGFGTVSDAVRLFADRAMAADATFTLAPATVDVVGALCERLDGIPLAIELAAARVRLLSPDQLLERIGDRLRLLAGGTAAVPRHQTLGALIDWSWDLLDEPARRLLERLAVFRGTFSLEDTEAVCTDLDAPRPDVVSSLAELVDHSLVAPVDGVDGAKRFVLLETIREYAWERLLAADTGAAPWRDRHAAWYEGVAARVAARYGDDDTPSWYAHLDEEQDNVTHALSMMTSPATLRRVVLSLFDFWQVRGYWSEARRWVETALSAGTDDETPSEERCRLLIHAANLMSSGADRAGAERLLDRAFAEARPLGDDVVLADVCIARAEVALEFGDPDVAQPHLDTARRLCPTDLKVQAVIRGREGLLAAMTGKLDAATALLDEAVVLSESHGTRRGATMLLNTLGMLAMWQGRLAPARSFFAQSLVLAQEFGMQHAIIALSNNLALIALHDTEFAEADRYLLLQRELVDRLGDTVSLAFNLLHRARLHLVQGRLGEARVLLTTALQCSSEGGVSEVEAGSYAVLATLDLIEGRGDDALTNVERAIEVAHAHNDPQQEAFALESKGAILATAGRLDEAIEATLAAITLGLPIGNEVATASAQVSLAGIRLDAGDPSAARALLREALPVLRDGDDAMAMLPAAETVARLAADVGDVETAVTLLRICNAQRQRIGAPRLFDFPGTPVWEAIDLLVSEPVADECAVPSFTEVFDVASGCISKPDPVTAPA